VLVRPLVSPASSATAVHWTSWVTVPRLWVPFLIFTLLICCRACHLFHRATEGDFASTFDGPVWAYVCDVCGRSFLKEAVGMTAWRAEARRSPPGTPRHRIPHLPVSRYRQGSCAACFSRSRGAAKCAAERPADAVAPSVSVFPPTERAHPPQPPATPPPSNPPQFPPDAVFPRASSGADTILSAARLHPHAVDSGSVSPTVPPVGAHGMPSCQAFLDYLLSGGVGLQEDQPILWRIASVILLHSNREEICLQQANGRPRVYLRKASPRKTVVKKSQRNKRRAAAERQFRTAGVVAELENEDSGAAGGRRVGRTLSVRDQVGLLFELRLSWTAFNKLRRALGGRKSGLGSLHVLRDAKRELSASPAKDVVVNTAEAHLAHLALAVPERLAALCDTGQFVERIFYGADHKTLRDEDAALPDDFDPGAWGCRPPATVPDVHITVGLDKGGDPGSVKIVVSIMNQQRPNKPGNTILAAVCPCHQDQYPQLSAIMAIQTPRLDELLGRGVDVRGERRPVRLLLSGDWESQSTVIGHKGPNATMPCYKCKSTKAPSITHATLDEMYGTLQDVSGPWHLRDADQYATCAEERVNCGQNSHLPPPSVSVTRPALVSPHPRQIVPIPVHLTLGINSRELRLAVEVVIRCCGRDAGSAFA